MSLGATPRGSGAVTPTRGAAATIEAGIQLAKEAALRKEVLLAQGQHVATPGAATPKSAAGSARSSGERRAESRASADAPAAGASTKRCVLFCAEAPLLEWWGEAFLRRRNPI